jgi:uncharacterized membrane protein YfcA
MWHTPAPPVGMDEVDAGPACRLQQPGPRLRWTPGCALALGITGALAGLLSGLLGVGGGFVIVPALSRVTHLDARSITTTSMGTIALVALGGLAGGLSNAPVAPAVTLAFGGASLLTLLLVRRLTHGSSPAWTRRAFALMCLVAAAMLAQRAWLTWP